MNQPSVPSDLHFTEHTIADEGSLALFWAQSHSKVGIYQLDFADGSSYVGQSTSMRTRLTAHRRRWNDVVKVRFADCPPELLNQLELATIRKVERTRPLRNRLLTNRPGGDDIRFTVSQGRMLALPWDRARRGAVSLPDSTRGHTALEGRKFASLERRPGYEGLAGATAALITGAFPSPTETQQILWSVSALPSTNRAPGWRRLLTLSAGRLEIFRVFEQSSNVRSPHPGYLNIVDRGKGNGVKRALMKARLGHLQVFDAKYRAVSGVQTIEIPDAVTARRVFAEPSILDGVYELVITLMRQNSAPLGKSHNPPLAEDLLRRAWSFQQAA